jgi:enoyl-CoA hydratase/carnithine racemase
MKGQQMTLTSYHSADGIASITMDDGKVNALSPEMLADVAAALAGVSDGIDRIKGGDREW